MLADTTTVRSVLEVVNVQVDRMPTDAWQLVATFVLGPAIAIGAAWLGGKMARKAALSAQHQAAEADRVARAEERQADRDARAHRIRSRITRTLERFLADMEELPTLSHDEFTFAKICAHLPLVWQTMEPRSDDLPFVGTPRFQERVESFAASLSAISAGVDAENAFRQQAMQLHAISNTGH